VPREVLSIIHVIRVKIKEYNEQLQEPDEFLYVSDRRWRKIVRLLRASAWFNDRDSVDLMDTFLIAHCIWQKPEQLDWAKDTVCDAIKQHGYTFQSEIGAIQKEIENFKKEVDLEISQVKQQHKEVIDFKQDKSYIDLLCELKLTNGESLILEESDYKLINENNQSIVRNTRYGQFEISKSQKKNYVLVKNTTRNIYSRMPSQEEVALPVKKYSKK
jgi:MoxR-like ATPase